MANVLFQKRTTKCGRDLSHNWFWLYFRLVEKVTRDFIANHKAWQCKTKAIELRLLSVQIEKRSCIANLDFLVLFKVARLGFLAT